MSDSGSGREADVAIRVEHIAKRFGAVRALGTFRSTWGAARCSA